MTDYAKGWKDAIEAAAKIADDRLQNGRESGCGRAIRALTPAEPPPREREGCAACGGSGRYWHGILAEATKPCPSCGGTGEGA